MRAQCGVLQLHVATSYVRKHHCVDGSIIFERDLYLLNVINVLS